jgi:hypothetical protein
MRAARHTSTFQHHNTLAPAVHINDSSTIDIDPFGTAARDDRPQSTTTSGKPESSNNSLTTIEDTISVSPLFSMQSLDSFGSTSSNSFTQSKSPAATAAAGSSGMTPGLLPMNPFSPYIGSDFTSLTNLNAEFEFHHQQQHHHQHQDVAQQLDQIMNMSFLDFASYTPGPLTTDTFSSLSSPSFSASPPSDMSPFETRWGPPPNRFVWTKLDEQTWSKLVEQLSDEKQVPPRLRTISSQIFILLGRN